ncbi:hypothetical protein ACLIJR_08845 [Hydrogenophaga sp. XSHU_21]
MPPPWTFTITPLASRTLQLDWPDVPGATAVRVYRDVDGEAGAGGFALVATLSGGDRRYTSTDLVLPEALHHRYRVEACIGVDCSTNATVAVAGNLAVSIPILRPGGLAAGSQAGRSLALASMALVGGQPGVVMAVGVPGAGLGQGAVKVFERRENGPWTPGITIGNEAGSSNDRFGHSVALSMDGLWLAVGVPGDDSLAPGGLAGGQDSGAVRLYGRTSTDAPWVFHANAKAPNGGVADQFGTAVALGDSGSELYVGAPFEDGEAQGAFSAAQANVLFADELAGERKDSGAVYRFWFGKTVGEAPFFEHYMKPVGETQDAYFGASLAAQGGIVAAGAPGASWGAPYAGGVQMFRYVSGAWGLMHTLYSIQPGAGPSIFRFGASLALSGDASRVAVGDPEATALGTVIRAGAAHVFQRSGSTWVEQQSFSAIVPRQNDRFGFSVALGGLQGDVLSVGVPEDDSTLEGLQRQSEVELDPNPTGRRDSGAVIRYVRSNLVWSFQARLKSSAPAMDEYFGRAVVTTRDGRLTAVGTRGQGASVDGNPPASIYIY